MSTRSDDGRERVDWFAIATAELDPASPDAVALAMLAIAQEAGLVTFAVTPFGATAVLAAGGRDEARVLGERAAACAASAGARRVGVRLTDRLEEAMPAASVVRDQAAREQGGG